MTKIVNAFQAFADWVVELVCDTVSTGGLDLEGIWSGAVERPDGLDTTLSRLAAEV